MPSYTPPNEWVSKPRATSTPRLYSPPGLTLGRFLFILVAIVVGFGPFVADFNETHVYNPNWPPHARFHNGQTMSLGAMLGLFTLFLAFRSSIFPTSSFSAPAEDAPRAAAEAQLDQEVLDASYAAVTGSLYFVAGMSAILYPGSKGLDPEFGEGFPQAAPFTVFALLPWIAWWLESTRVSNQRLLLAARAAKWE